MNKRVINISSDDSLGELLDQHALPPGASIQTLITAILEEAKGAGMERCIIRINSAIISSSYLSVPAMFATTLRGRSPYPCLQSYLKGETMVVNAGLNEVPVTFRAKVLAGLRGSGSYKAKRKDVPETYRARPHVLAKALEGVLIQRVTVVKDATTIEFRLK